MREQQAQVGSPLWVRVYGQSSVQGLWPHSLPTLTSLLPSPLPVLPKSPNFGHLISQPITLPPLKFSQFLSEPTPKKLSKDSSSEQPHPRVLIYMYLHNVEQCCQLYILKSTFSYIISFYPTMGLEEGGRWWRIVVPISSAQTGLPASVEGILGSNRSLLESGPLASH